MKYYNNFNFDKLVSLSEMTDYMFFTFVSNDHIVFNHLIFANCLWVRTSEEENGRILCYRYNRPEFRVYLHKNRPVFI